MRTANAVIVCVSLSVLGFAASKPHTVAFGKWTTVRTFTGEDESAPIDLKIRPLLVDGGVKDLTLGQLHDVTDRVFVVQRVYRLNDLLPQEKGPSRWRWERGSWLLVDRVSGKVRTISLPLFDAYYSQVSWFRDYAAYCGFSDDRQEEFTVVAQLGKRKPLLKQVMEKKRENSPLDAPCPPPQWSRAPARVTFDVAGEPKFTFTARSQAVDLVKDDEEDEGKD